MFSTDDTIVAVATPPGRGGLAVVRLSGGEASRIGRAIAGRVDEFPARRPVRVRLSGIDVPDDALVTRFPAPASYTGEDVVEVSAHGSPVVTAAILRAATSLGARAARPGEFTLRAYVNGKIDLLQAEAVQALVDAVSPAQARLASGHLGGALSAAIAGVSERLRDLHVRLEASIDFPDEGYHFVDRGAAAAALEDLRARLDTLIAGDAQVRRLRDGWLVVVAGAPNVGKSSVFNALLGADRAIVTPVAGTTRDLLSEHVLVDGVHLRLVDTAGVRAAADVVEREGVRRATAMAAEADVVVVVLDRSRPLADEDRAVLDATAPARRVVVANKGDLTAAWAEASVGVDVTVSAAAGTNIDVLGRRLAAQAAADRDGAEPLLVTNERQLAHVRAARAHIAHACDAVAEAAGELPEEFLITDLVLAQRALEELTGGRSSEAVLEEIFERFCIGK